jgi:hypothetical protein
MGLRDLAAAADQMRETGLMAGLLKLAIQCPSVAHQDALEVGTQDRRRFVEAAAMLNGIDHGRRGREGPQPPELARHFPARFIGTHNRAAAHLLAQGLVGRRRLPGGAVERMRDALGRTCRPNQSRSSTAILPCDSPSCLLSSTINSTACGPRCARGTQRISRLQRMASLHAASTAAAAADVHVKAAYMGTHDRQILLNLDRHARFSDAPAAVQTHVRERHVDDLIDAGWRPTMTVAAVSATRTPSSPPRIRFWRALRERRRLALPSAPRGGEFLLQLLVLALQSLARALRFLELPTEPIDFSIEILE